LLVVENAFDQQNASGDELVVVGKTAHEMLRGPRHIIAARTKEA
jgi:hypothetical protein